MNISTPPPEETISAVFKALSTPVRVRILAVIGKSEACVCHLEAVLGLRQAYISQQLMEMRDANLLQTRREGRYIYYSLIKPDLIDLLFDIGGLLDIPIADLQTLLRTTPVPSCCCPHCIEEISSRVNIQEIRAS